MNTNKLVFVIACLLVIATLYVSSVALILRPKEQQRMCKEKLPCSSEIDVRCSNFQPKGGRN